MAYHTYKDVQGFWRWYLLASNGKKIANSGEGYFNKQDCIDAIALVKTSTTAAVYQD